MIQEIISKIKIEELINNNEYKELINNLEKIYDINSNVSILQDSFVFPSSILRQDFELFTKSLDTKNNSWTFVSYYQNTLLKELNNEIENYNNLFIIHYYVLSIIEKKYRDYNIKIREEKEKIKDCLKENKKNIKRIFVLAAPYNYVNYKENIDIYPSMYIQTLINKLLNNSKKTQRELQNYLEITNFSNKNIYNEKIFIMNVIIQENSNQKMNTTSELTEYIKTCIEFQKYISKVGGVNNYKNKIKSIINELRLLDISSINNIDEINQKLDQCYNASSNILFFNENFLKLYEYLNSSDILESEIIIKKYFELLRKKYYMEINYTNSKSSINNQEKYNWIEDYILNKNNSDIDSFLYYDDLITKIAFHKCDRYMENPKTIMNDYDDEILSFYKIEKEEKMPYLVFLCLWLFWRKNDNSIFIEDYRKHFNMAPIKVEKPITKEDIIDYLNHNEVPINTLEEINKLLIKKTSGNMSI